MSLYNEYSCALNVYGCGLWFVAGYTMTIAVLSIKGLTIVVLSVSWLCTQWLQLRSLHNDQLQSWIHFIKWLYHWLKWLYKTTIELNFLCKMNLEHTTFNVTKSTIGWRRLIGCLKLQVIFRKRATKYRALLRKLTSKGQAYYGSSPPCTL